MSATYVVDACTPSEWHDVCQRFEDYNIYQTWAYGQMSAVDTGSNLSRIILHEGSKTLGAAQIRLKQLPLLRCGLAYLYFGPMVGRDAGPEVVHRVIEALREEYVVRRRLRLRIVPPFRDSGDCVQHIWPGLGFSRALRAFPYRTFLVDLAPELEQLRKSLEQKWRNCLNQSERHGVSIEIRDDDRALADFEALYESMWDRKQFETGVRVSSFRRLQQALPADAKLTILLARLNGQLGAGHVSSTLGDTCVYLLGASNDVGRGCKASYALQWQAMLHAKRCGARWYDLGGINRQSNPGVYHFKAGLGGKETLYAGTFEACSRGIGAKLVPFAERIYRALMQKKTRGFQHPLQTEPRRKPPLPDPCPTVVTKLSL